MTEIIESKLLFVSGKGGRKCLATHELTVRQKGQDRPYYVVTRGRDAPTSEDRKFPEAVIVVATIETDGQKRLVLVDQFRPAIGGREISFPAGLIDDNDWLLGDGKALPTAERAAQREFFEEVGLKLNVTEISPPNLYSSSGMTNESSIVVFGNATGEPSIEHNEPTEDIRILLWSHQEIQEAIRNPGGRNFSKISWPMLYLYAKMGL